MAKRRYRPYRSRKQQSRRQVRLISLMLLVLIVGVIIVVKTTGDDGQPAEAGGAEDVRSVDSILPLSGNDTAGPVEDEAERDAEPEPAAAAAPEPPTSPRSAEPERISEPVRDVVVLNPEPAPAVSRDVQTVQTPPADSDNMSPEAQDLIEKALELEGNGKIIAARDLLNHTLDLKLSARVRAAVKERMAKLANVWLFGGDVYESDTLTAYYLVQPGDLLAVIAKRYKVPYELLMDINNIDRPESLQAGKRIKVVEGPFNAVIYKDSFTMDLYLQNVYVKTYRVGLGKVEHETPTGRWRVEKGGKLIRPKWTDPDTGKVYVGSAPDYPLGSRWIALEGLDGAAVGRTGFAIHGTKEPETIGTRSSRGCIRLYNGDVIEVYNLLQDGLSEVLVLD